MITDHQILEIRQRALQTVYNKLFRGLLKEDEPEYDAVVLIKMLLKWFKCVPLVDEEIVLNAMKLVLKVTILRSPFAAKYSYLL